MGDNEGFLLYTRTELFTIRGKVLPVNENNFNIELPPELLWNRYDSTKKSQRRKRGKKGGIRVKNRRRPNRLPLPSVMFGNVRSIVNKEDKL